MNHENEKEYVRDGRPNERANPKTRKYDVSGWSFGERTSDLEIDRDQKLELEQDLVKLPPMSEWLAVLLEMRMKVPPFP
jgi:hypothetical protein